MKEWASRTKRRLAFFVPGIPAAQPSRGAAVGKNGKPYTFTRTGAWVQWRADVKQFAAAAMEQDGNTEPMTDSVFIDATFIFPRTKSAPMIKPKAHKVKPDLSNLLKNLEDALKGVLLADDKIVNGAELHKLYAMPGGRVGVSLLFVESHIALCEGMTSAAPGAAKRSERYGK